MTVDIVTVHYNILTRAQTVKLFDEIRRHHLNCLNLHFIPVDNSVQNRGFGKACNIGAAKGNGDVIAFINPDAEIDGPFLDEVERVFTESPQLLITGCRFGKPEDVVASWHLPDWICGAAFFVRRYYFEERGGFDERYVWSWEETDFLQRTWRLKGSAAFRSIELPIRHQSPNPESEDLGVLVYKNHHLQRGAKLYREKWNF